MTGQTKGDDALAGKSRNTMEQFIGKIKEYLSDTSPLAYRPHIWRGY